MSQKLLEDTSYFLFLQQIDADIAETARNDGCPHCRAPLDRAAYRRKPRGLAADPGDDFALRASFCCRRDGCRRRVTPPSLRFLGRRVYVAVVVAVATMLASGATPRRMAEVTTALAVSARTIRRWLAWWRRDFVRGDIWASIRARTVPPPAESELPASLYERIMPGGDDEVRMTRLLRCITGLGVGM